MNLPPSLLSASTVSLSTVLRYWLNELTAPSDARLDLTCTLSVDGVSSLLLPSVTHRPRRYVLPGVADSVRWLMVSPLYGVSCSPSFAGDYGVGLV